MSKAPNEIFDAMKDAIIDSCITGFDGVDGVCDGVEIEPTKEGFEVMLFRGDDVHIHFGVTLTDLNATE